MALIEHIMPYSLIQHVNKVARLDQVKHLILPLLEPIAEAVLGKRATLYAYSQNTRLPKSLPSIELEIIIPLIERNDNFVLPAVGSLVIHDCHKHYPDERIFANGVYPHLSFSYGRALLESETITKFEGKKGCSNQSFSNSCTKCGLCLLDKKDKHPL
jgi:hypothetical protein